MNLLIVGASAGLGRALATEAARRGHNMLLVASDERDLRALTAHLHLQYGVRAEYLAFHIQDSVETEWGIVAAAQKFTSIDGLLFPLGYASDGDDGNLDTRAAKRLVEINFLSIAAVTHAFWHSLASTPGACVVGFGSIASIRGRSRNVVYAAAKRALGSYFESLRHIAVGTKIRVQFYELGYLDTQQTIGKHLLFSKVTLLQQLVSYSTGYTAIAEPHFIRGFGALLPSRSV